MIVQTGRSGEARDGTNSRKLDEDGLIEWSGDTIAPPIVLQNLTNILEMQSNDVG